MAGFNDLKKKYHIQEKETKTKTYTLDDGKKYKVNVLGTDDAAKVGSNKFRSERFETLIKEKKNDVRNRPDYAAVSKRGRENYQQFYDDKTSNWFGDWVKDTYAGKLVAPQWEKYSEEEKDMYGYLYETDKDKANKYMLELNKSYEAAERKKKTDNITEWAEERPVMASVASLVANVGAPIDYIKNVGGGMATEQIFGEGVILPKTGFSDVATSMQKGVQKRISENTDLEVMGANVAAQLYGMGMSIANSAALITAMGPLAVVEMSMQAAASATNEALDRGVSDVQAVKYGTAAGVAEALGEYLSIEHLFKLKSPHTIKQAIKSALTQAGVEASEEAATTVMNSVSDFVINGDKSEYATQVAFYLSEGYSQKEAEGKATWDSIKGLAWDAIGGAVSGLVLGGGSMALGKAFGNTEEEIGARKAVKDLGKDKGAILDYAMETEEGSEVREAAEDIRARTERGEKVSNKEYADVLLKTDNNFAKAEIKKQLEAEATSTGEELSDEQLDSMSTAVLKTMRGEFVSENENAQIEQSKTAKNVYARNMGVDYTYGEQLSKEKKTELKETRAQQVLSEAVKDHSEGYKQTLTKAYEDYAQSNESFEMDAEDFANEFSSFYDIGRAGVESVDRALEAYGKGNPQLTNALARAYELGKGENRAENIAQAEIKQQAAKKGVKGKIVFEGKVKNRIRNKQQAEAINFMANVLKDTTNMEYHIFASYEKNGERYYKNSNGNEIKAPNGFYDPDAHQIWIDVNAGSRGQGIMLYTLTHEHVHDIRVWSPEHYNNLLDIAVQTFEAKGMDFEKAAQDKYKSYIKNHPNYTMDAAREEVVADMMSGLLSDEKGLAEFSKQIQQKDASLWNRIKAWFKDVIARITKAYEDTLPESYEARMLMENKELFEHAQKVFAEAVVTAGQNYKNAGVESSTGQVKNADTNAKFQARNSDGSQQNQEKDSEGNILSAKQAEFFEDSKVRDENGNLLVVYHGTRKADFTVFNRSFNFFTDSEKMADSYAPNGEKFQGYLNIEKPFIIDAKGEKWSKIPIDSKTKDLLDRYGSSSFKEGGKWRSTPADIVYAIIDSIDEGEFDYDGVIVKNVDDTGSYLKGKNDVVANDYITFNSNQFKNLDNKAPTKDPDIRYQDRDSEYMEAVKKADIGTMQKLVEEAAKAAMPNSKIVDENGNLRKVYHGTNETDFNVFDPRYIGTGSGDEGYFGRGFYFAYTKGEAAFYGAKRIISAYMNIKNPFNFEKEIYSYNGEKPKFTHTLDAVAFINFAEKFPEIAKNTEITVSKKGSGEYENINLVEFAKAFKDVIDNKDFEISEITDSYGEKRIVATADRQDKEFTMANGEIHKWVDFGFNQSFYYDTPTRLDVAYSYLENAVFDYIDIYSPTHVILDNSVEFTETLKNKGFDGTIQSEYGDEVVAFYPKQIKSADPVTYDDEGKVIPLSERFKKENDDIRYSERDSDGRELSEAQAEFFKDSKVRDENGNLLVMYHGSENDFTEFDKNRMGKNAGSAYGFGFYFTESLEGKGLASAYAYGDKILKGYVNIKNPLSTTQKTISKEAYLEIGRKLKERHNSFGYPFYFSEIYDDARSDFELYAQINSRHPDIVNKTEDPKFIQNEFMNLGFDGVIRKFDGMAIHAVTFDSNQFKSVDNKTPTTDPDIRYSLREGNIGYHAGDLGKAESLGNQSGGRDTGHFGTGTYFVGDEAAINISGYKDRPHEKVDFSKYNLFKVTKSEDAHTLHEFLKGVNEYFDRDNSYVKSEKEVEQIKEQIEDMAFDLDEYDSDFLETVIKLVSKVTGKHRVSDILKKNLKGEYWSYDGEIYKEGTLESKPVSIKELWKDIVNVDRLIYDLENTLDDYWTLRPIYRYQDWMEDTLPKAIELFNRIWDNGGNDMSEKVIFHIMDEIRTEIEKADYGYEERYKADSASTRFMKWLGYEGIDVRGVEDYDNTAYGSVIYDLKGEDAARKQEIGTARYQDRLSTADQNRVVILEDQIKRLKADIKEIEHHYEKAQDYARAEGILIGQVEQGKEMAKTIASKDAELLRKKESYERKAKNYEDMLEAKRAKIAEIRQRRDEILAEQKAAFKEYREQRNEAIRSGGTRKSIEKNAKTLMDWLLKNSDKEHIPEALKTTVGEFLETIDFTSKRGLAGGEPTKKDQAFAQKLNNLAAMLEKQRNYMNSANEGDAENPLDCFLDLPEGFAEEIRKLADDVAKTAIGGNFVINDMNSEQLAQLNKALRVLKTSISKMNKLITNAHFASVTEAARNSMLEMAEYKAHKPMNDISEQADKMLKWEMFTPVYAFKRYGNAGESIFKGIQKGWGDFAFAIDKVLKFTEGTYTDKEVEAWEKETHSIKLSDGNTVTLTTAQLMSLYCLNKREQARGHIYGGGIRIADIKEGKAKIQQTEPYLISFEDVETLISELSDRQIAVADKLQEFMTEQGSEWGNKVSMERFGYRAFTEENYFPIESDANNLIAIDPEAKANDMFRLLNMSATKSLTKGANNAIVISDIFDIFSNHMSDMAKYGSLALPILDTMKWYNYKVRYDVGDGQFRTETVQKSVERAYGKAGKSYFTNFMKDLNGVKEGGRGIGLINKMVSNYKIASVGANLRVAVLQPTSIVRASMEIEPKYILQALTKAPAAKEAEKKSGIALWKSLGFYNTDIARGIRDQIKGGGKTIDKVRDKTMILAEKMDRITFGTLWNAAEAKAKGLGYSGEELDVKTTEIFDNIIYKTQVVDSTLTRSSLMRSTNEAVKSITAFMAEPTLSYNMVAETVYDMAKERDFSTGWQKNSERFGKAVAIYAASSIAAAVIESIPDAFRDDDDEEWFGQKWWQAFWGERFWDGNLLSEINVLEKIPLLKDFISVRKGYDIQRLDAAWMSSLNKAIEINTELYNVYVKGEKPTKTTYWGNMTAYGAAYANLRAISQIAGLPVSNTVRDIVAIWNTIVGGMAPSLKVKTYDDSKKK